MGITATQEVWSIAPKAWYIRSARIVTQDNSYIGSFKSYEDAEKVLKKLDEHQKAMNLLYTIKMFCNNAYIEEQIQKFLEEVKNDKK